MVSFPQTSLHSSIVRTTLNFLKLFKKLLDFN